MGTFTPNPSAEAGAEFDLVKAGIYRLRLVDVGEETQSEAGNTYSPLRFEFADRSQCYKEDGTPANNPGNIFDRSVLTAPAEKQGKLRSLVESFGCIWGSVTNLQDLVGQECTCKVAVERDKNGVYEPKNGIKRYLPVK